MPSIEDGAALLRLECGPGPLPTAVDSSCSLPTILALICLLRAPRGASAWIIYQNPAGLPGKKRRRGRKTTCPIEVRCALNERNRASTHRTLRFMMRFPEPPPLILEPGENPLEVRQELQHSRLSDLLRRAE